MLQVAAIDHPAPEKAAQGQSGLHRDLVIGHRPGTHPARCNALRHGGEPRQHPNPAHPGHEGAHHSHRHPVGQADDDGRQAPQPQGGPDDATCSCALAQEARQPQGRGHGSQAEGAVEKPVAAGSQSQPLLGHQREHRPQGGRAETEAEVDDERCPQHPGVARKAQAADQAGPQGLVAPGRHRRARLQRLPGGRQHGQEEERSHQHRQPVSHQGGDQSGHGRADGARGIEGNRAQRHRLGQQRPRDQTVDGSLLGRLVEGVAQPAEQRADDQGPGLQPAGMAHQAHAGRGQAHHQVGNNQDVASIDKIGHRTGHQPEQQERQGAGGLHQPHQQGRAAEAGHQPAGHGRLHRVGHGGGDGTDVQQPVGTDAQRRTGQEARCPAL